ncbi:MAG TPA: TetR/AcrR family transcriptional regulator [Coleofasciculaceae cyanobacterium]
MNSESVAPRAAKTRDRLLKAAAQVFATAGVDGATTREIARVAEVNEVTLFRHFQSKEQLLGAVIRQVSALQTEALDQQNEWTQDLQTDLLHYAWLYNNMLEEHEALIRTFIGEAKRHPEAARSVLQETAQNLRDRLIAYLSLRQQNGTVRADVNLRVAVDQLTGMLLAGMLRRSVVSTSPSYSRESYIEESVALLVRGIAATPAPENQDPEDLF